jgi:hypothetical protein
MTQALGRLGKREADLADAGFDLRGHAAGR